MEFLNVVAGEVDQTSTATSEIGASSSGSARESVTSLESEGDLYLVDDPSTHPVIGNGAEIGGTLEPIAVVGLALKFPDDATTPEAFWQMLLDKKCASKDYPVDRMNVDSFYHPDKIDSRKISTRGAHFMTEDVRAFDAPFFSITPQEAGTMDPQHRGLLEATYHALENAGIAMDAIAGSDTSVHVGCFTADYTTMNWRDAQQIPKYSATGTASSILSNRLSWFYDLHGASMTIDTACSSGMVAVDLACNGIWSGQSKMAIAAGANVIFTPELNIALSNMSFLSPDAKCYSFDHRANGYARGEGYGVLVLKPVSQAIQDGDTIRALIRSTGLNQDGHTHGGITQPSKDLQASLIRETYQKAGLDMERTRFFEAHGTGTAIGDPLEARAIGECFRNYRKPSEPLYVGAVKSNIGHLEGTSGFAGIIKAILAVERGCIPPNTNFERLNPEIDAELFNLEGARRASVNSFGFGGTNGHIIIDDAFHYIQSRRTLGQYQLAAPSTRRFDRLLADHCDIESGAREKTKLQPRLLVWSAADKAGIQRLSDTYGGYLRKHAQVTNATFVDRLAYTLNMRRTSHAWKAFAVVDSFDCMSRIEEAISSPVRASVDDPRLTFVFTGQGAQWYGMGRELLTYTVFKESLLQSQVYLRDLGCQWLLLDELSKDEPTTRVNEPEFSQPLCSAIQVALVDLYASFNVKPNVVVGHSSGEIAAAYCAGLLCQKSAIKVAYHRGVLSSRLSKSGQNCSMMSVVLSQIEAETQLIELEQQDPTFKAAGITVSCVNSPSNVTVSGDKDQLRLLAAHLEGQNVIARQLKIDVAYHSPQMQQIASEYLAALEGLEGRDSPSRITMVSSVTGKLIDAEIACQSDYWVRNMVSPVSFAEAMRITCVRSQQENIVKKLDRSHEREIITNFILELGAHSALKGPIRDVVKSVDRSNDVTYDSALVRNRSATITFLQSIGRLHCQNFAVDLARLSKPYESSAKASLVLPDLPQYPFDHSTIYWEEAQSDKNMLFREYPSHDLLGAQVIDWNPMEAKWTFFIKASDLPWTVDHKINGSILYPAAGMLAAVIEATKLLVKDKSPVGYEIKNAEFIAPLLLTTSPNGTETQISLTSPTSSNTRDSTKYYFRIFGRKSNDAWEEVCNGSVQADYGRVVSDVDEGKEADESSSQFEKLHLEAAETCTRPVDETKIYQQLKEDSGIDYGPAFQVLDSMRHDDQSAAIASIEALRGDPKHSSTSYVIHPTTLDGLFQLVFVALTRGGTASLQTMVPKRVDRVWVSAFDEMDPSPIPLQVHADARLMTRRTARSHISALEVSNQKLGVDINGLELTAVAEKIDSLTENQDAKKICYHMSWKPDLGSMNNKHILDYCRNLLQDDLDPSQWFQDLELLLLSYGAQVSMKGSVLEQNQSEHLKKYAFWLQKQLNRFLSSAPVESREQLGGILLDRAHHQALVKRVSVNKRGQLHVMIGERLQDMLIGDVDPLHLLVGEHDHLTDFYTEMITSSQAFDRLGRYLECLVHKNPDLEFLEVGAGTGATTGILLKTLGGMATPFFRRYNFTDISPAFTEKARDAFSEQKRMTFCALDVEQPLGDQGFSEGQYDVVVGSLVLHATKDLGNTLQNVRKLLKPGGKLIFMELTMPESIRTGFIFGLLSGWWLGCEPYRQESPCISLDRWSQLLQSNGFSGNDLVFNDYQSEDCQMWSVIVSTAITEAATELPSLPAPKYILDKGIQEQRDLAEILIETSSVPDHSSSMLSLEEAASASDLDKQHYVMLLDLSSDVLFDMMPTVFTDVQRILTSSQSLLWVTRGGSKAPPNPNHGIFKGLSRTSRNENPKTAIVSVDLEFSNEQSATQRDAALIHDVFQKTICGLAQRLFEPEYRVRDGHLQINRLVEAPESNEHIFQRTTQPVQYRKLEGSPPLKLNVKTPGLLDSLEFTTDTSFEEPLAPDEIEIDVQTIGVNFKECLIVLGRVQTDKLGSECAGIVTAVGSQCKSVQEGDRVALCDLNCYKTRIRVKEIQAVKIPDTMSFVEAASIPTAFTTAYYSLVEVARLEEGESVLIHAGAGGTGQAAIQVAKHVGADIFATVGSLKKKSLLMDTYDIKEDHIFYSRDTSFADGIKRVTGGRGVDVVLNSLSDEGLRESWECVADFGRFIEIGRKDIDARGSLPMHPFIKNLSFIGVDLAGIAEQRPAVGHRILQKAMDLFEAGVFRTPYPLQTYGLDGIEKAFRFLQSGKGSGKVVLEIRQDAELPIVAPPTSGYSFERDATYLIAGGLGGIGRSIARWLVQRGARHLILLSRSGPQNNEPALALLKDLRELDVNIECPTCDISDLHALQTVIQQYSRTMPPIKGCFQASMVLRDATFARMTHTEWTQSTSPKIHGSWNLHLALPTGLDFFILLSSVCGVFGNGGQSNYAAGNTFQDALAAHRVSLGEKAISLDLGIILDQGFVAENTQVMEHLLRLSLLMPISQAELFALLDYYCNPGREVVDPVQSQVITGLELPADQRAKGKDVLVAMQQPLFSHMGAMDATLAPSTTTTSSSSSSTALDLRKQFQSATSPAEAADVVSEALKAKLSRILGVDYDSITLDSRIESFGVDSLVAVELRNWLAKEVDADVAVFEILGAATVRGVGVCVAGKSGLRGGKGDGGGEGKE
ncbi:Type I Iterative PKS [Bacidia gigantensis]|uniref:Type I Iterative PKS n=1 Tax=Bacidia gigantensis TaxID=2732470 RepID=UPI001D0529CE|nr:Type I Iterative PKS [Bacidia gigantensis]KAG8531947.1 Type I Iterative PKS [Bacidia gigantensis]